MNTGVVLTVVNGTGDDLTVNGTVNVEGTLTIDAVAGASHAVIGSGGTISVLSNATMNVGRQGNGYSTLTVNSGGYLYVNGTYDTAAAGNSNNQTYTTISDGATIAYGPTGYTTNSGALVLSSGATMVVSSATGINGHFEADNILEAATTGTNFVFTGTANNMVTGTYMPITVNNVTIDNPNNVTFTNATTIVGTLSETQGSATNVTTADGYDGGYMDITENGVNLTGFSASSSTATPDSPNYFVDRTWSYTASNDPAVNKEFTFYWDAADDGYYPWSDTDFPGVWVNNALQIPTSYDYSSDPRSITLTLASDTNFSQLKVGKSDGGTLPVELSSFTAVISATNYVQLQWVTQSETNVSGYRLYRGSDLDLSTAVMLNAFIEATNTSQMQVYVYWDEEVWESGTYYYWLQNLDFDGSSAFHGPISIIVNLDGGGSPVIPVIQGISSIYPNPFYPNTAVRFGIVRPGNVKVAVYNTRGQIVRELFEGFRDQGTHTLQWDGTDANGSALPSGMYVIRMTSGTQVYQRKAILMK